MNPNKLVEAATLLIFILGGALFESRPTDYRDWDFDGFPQSLQANARVMSQIMAWSIPSTPFPINCS
jgi:hypothetical protein